MKLAHEFYKKCLILIGKNLLSWFSMHHLFQKGSRSSLPSAKRGNEEKLWWDIGEKVKRGGYAIKTPLSVLLLRIFACQALPEPAQKSYINWEDSNNQRPFYSIEVLEFSALHSFSKHLNSRLQLKFCVSSNKTPLSQSAQKCNKFSIAL